MTTTKPIPAVIRFAADPTGSESYRPLAERIIEGDPVQAATNFYASGDGRFNSGVWQSERGKWRVVFTESEFCYLLAGVIVVTSDDGSMETFKAGDAFVSPAGFRGTWEIIVPAKKFYAFYE
ncbi:MAG: cupin domain-containing protein [Hyphomicrobium sp.]|jgi:hypothetical protein